MIGRILVAATFALAVTACADTAVQPTEIADPLFAAGGNSGPSANGAGHFDVGDELRTFSFHANTAKDGSVSGQAQIKRRDVDITTHIEVNCLRVVGNIAYVSGVITNTNFPPYDGQGVVWAVQDNGEGANDPPDRISLASVGGPTTGWCAVSPVPGNVIDGNIQVKP